MVATMARESERNNSTRTKPHTHQQEFHSSELPSALQSLTEQRRWVCWCWKWREEKGKPGEGKWTKPPIQCGTGWPAYASTDDASTWGTYGEAVARLRNSQADGIGYCLNGISKSLTSRLPVFLRNPVPSAEMPLPK